MYFRSDLASEVCEKVNIEGIVKTRDEIEGANILKTEILTDEAAEKLGKPKGKYITFEFEDFSLAADEINATAEKLASFLSQMIPKGLCLVVGLGNTDITPDSLGPKTVNGVLATRHIGESVKKSMHLDALEPVAVLSPGVLGKTGIESAQIVHSLVKEIKPKSVIAVDAFASKSADRLGKTVQICDSGISPGSGVGNSRLELSEKTLGIPVISIGVPTVVDAGTLVCNVLGADSEEDSKPYLKGKNMFVTPREIDIITQRAAHLLSLSINKALQPDFTIEEINMLL